MTLTAVDAETQLEGDFVSGRCPKTQLEGDFDSGRCPKTQLEGDVDSGRCPKTQLEGDFQRSSKRRVLTFWNQMISIVEFVTF